MIRIKFPWQCLTLSTYMDITLRCPGKVNDMKQTAISAYFLTIVTEAKYSSETSVGIHQITRHYISEDRTPHIRHL
jgi:hypothetical protein